MDTIRASKENFEAYLNRVGEALPEGFEDSIGHEGLWMGATGYVFTSFMHGVPAKTVASELVRMIGVKVT